MSTRRRSTSSPDQAIASSLYTIATRTWVPPEGEDRQARLDELRERADGRTDLFAQTAGLVLGLRVEDEHDPRYKRHTGAAEMLLELAGVAEDDPAVQEWVEIGRDRRERNQIRPEPRREW